MLNATCPDATWGQPTTSARRHWWVARTAPSPATAMDGTGVTSCLSNH
jgi:hypothetical protein